MIDIVREIPLAIWVIYGGVVAVFAVSLWLWVRAISRGGI